MPARPMEELVHDSWVPVLQPAQEHLTQAGTYLRTELAEGRSYLPAAENVLRVFQTPLEAVRVLIVGQDPYPTPGHAVGLCFSVAPDVRPVPRSLQNIFTEMETDLGLPKPDSGDLSPWVDQGVLLLNRVLTVRPGAPGSHQNHGWEHVTAAAIQGLVARGGPLVAVLWGRQARSLAPHLGPIPYVESSHPSPLSARSGFFGSRPFSRVNALLEQQGAGPIDWSLAQEAARAPEHS